jgi:4-diphosphocytidyl-2-C-methyl-D-erythritol kinase
MHLHKIIPMGAGLGGGSSNAAWTLRLLNDIFSLRLSPSALEQYAARLGSDCAFFIRDKAMVGRGRGEILTETTVDLRGKFFIVVNPVIHISTAEAFSGVIPRQPDQDLQYILENVSITEWKHRLRNDFEESIMKKHPVIAAVKDLLYNKGALYACMSGSGSSVFGIFSSALNLEEAFAGMHYYSGKF